MPPLICNLDRRAIWRRILARKFKPEYINDTTFSESLVIISVAERLKKNSPDPNFRRELSVALDRVLRCFLQLSYLRLRPDFEKWWRILKVILFIRHTIAVCTSAQRSNVAGMLAKLGELAPRDVDFRLVELPYNDLDSFRLPRGLYDGLILCHSIHNRRFAITDVLDALYNQFLPHVANLLGKANVAVIVHDFSWPLRQTTKYSDELFSESEVHAMVKETFMDSFRVRQPTTFECCHIARICGRLDEGTPRPEMDEGDMDEIKTFISNIHANFNRTKEQMSSVHDKRHCLDKYKKAAFDCINSIIVTLRTSSFEEKKKKRHVGVSVNMVKGEIKMDAAPDEQHQGTSDHHELNISSAISLQQDEHHQHEKHQRTSAKEGHELDISSANTSDCDKAEEKTLSNILNEMSSTFSFI